MNWTAHIEHLQTVLKEFNFAVALNKEVLICHFCNGLKSSIGAKSNKQDQDLDIWEEAIKKAIYTEAKAACQP